MIDRLRVLRSPAFRGVYFGGVCSGLTDGLIPVAFALQSVRAFGSPTAMSTILLALWIGRFACTPLAGRVAARRDRFLVMMWSDLGRAIAQGGLALAIIVIGHDSLAFMALSAALYGAATAFFGPALWSSIPTLVERRDLDRANGLLAVNTDISVLLGPTIAVVLMSAIGFRAILILDALTFLVNIAALAYARGRAPRVHEDSNPDPDRDTAADHTFAATIRATPWLGWSTALWFMVSVSIGVVAVAGPVSTIGKSGSGAHWAALATGMAAASLMGSLSVVAGLGRIRWAAAAVAVAVAFSFEVVALALYPQLRGGVDIVVLFGACAIAGLVNSVSGIAWQTTIQRVLPTGTLAHFSSVEGFVNAAGVPIGMFVGGIVAAHGALPAAAIVLCVLMIGSAIAGGIGIRERAYERT